MTEKEWIAYACRHVGRRIRISRNSKKNLNIYIVALPSPGGSCKKEKKQLDT